MLEPTYCLPDLAQITDVETIAVLRALKDSHRYLAELKGRSGQIPNQGILIDTLSLQEAKASSEVENIITTQDELFKAASSSGLISANAKEVANYADALKFGFDQLGKSDGLITNNTVIGMFQKLKDTNAKFRVTPGTALKNESDGNIVYVPPQDANKIAAHMNLLEAYINTPEISRLDPLVKMALIHHQFESIHPFSDGNGRIGRILNVLYLTQQGLLETPVLYLSRFITQNKEQYYHLLQETRDKQEWEPWILFMLRAVKETSEQTIWLIGEIKKIMAELKYHLRSDHSTLYSQDLINNMFRHPYTRIEYVMDEVGVGRQTAARYLDRLANAGILEKTKQGKNNYYINTPLVNLLIKGFGA